MCAPCPVGARRVSRVDPRRVELGTAEDLDGRFAARSAHVWPTDRRLIGCLGLDGVKYPGHYRRAPNGSGPQTALGLTSVLLVAELQYGIRPSAEPAPFLAPADHGWG